MNYVGKIVLILYLYYIQQLINNIKLSIYSFSIKFINVYKKFIYYLNYIYF